MALVGPSAERLEFVQVFNRLCVALREKDADAATMQVYFDALADLPFAAVQQGAVALQNEPGRKWFPTTGEWREAAQEAGERQLKAAVKHAREEPWRLECTLCEDTGWRLADCSGDSFCGRERKHAAHGFARACACRPTNRTWARHQKFGAGE